MTMANSSIAPAVEQIQFGYLINNSYPVYGTANWYELGQNQSYLKSRAPVGDSRGWTHWAWTVSGSISTFYRNGFYVNTVDMGSTVTALTSNQRVLHYLGAGVSLVDNRCGNRDQTHHHHDCFTRNSHHFSSVFFLLGMFLSSSSFGLLSLYVVIVCLN